MTKLDGRVIIGFGGILSGEQLAEIKEWWENPKVRAVYLHYEEVPNRLYGAQINADGEAV